MYAVQNSYAGAGCKPEGVSSKYLSISSGVKHHINIELPVSPRYVSPGGACILGAATNRREAFGATIREEELAPTKNVLPAFHYAKMPRMAQTQWKPGVYKHVYKHHAPNRLKLKCIYLPCPRSVTSRFFLVFGALEGPLRQSAKFPIAFAPGMGLCTSKLRKNGLVISTPSQCDPMHFAVSEDVVGASLAGSAMLTAARSTSHAAVIVILVAAALAASVVAVASMSALDSFFSPFTLRQFNDKGLALLDCVENNS
ncbi:hypothetical protein C8R44DRAFT_861950 [Mycena epipterygia]|nr:hypothetical protein C8R44DRAFT_861950 [Mycena epipterygia]